MAPQGMSGGVTAEWRLIAQKANRLTIVSEADLSQPERSRGRNKTAGWSEKRQTIVFLIVVACIIVVVALVGSLALGDPDDDTYQSPAPLYEEPL